MQKVAAYLLERREGMETAERRAAEVKTLLGVLSAWLNQKGAKKEDEEGGTFESPDSQATYRWEQADAQGRSWKLLKLDEISNEQKRFITAVSITDTSNLVAVYVSLEAGLAYSTIAPISIQPRCPRFLHKMLSLSGTWYHGPSKFYNSRKLIGEDDGKWIAQEISTTDRTLPILLIAEDDGEVLIPKLDQYLAKDLAGLANVFVLDHEAAWGLTNSLGKQWSCYWGAIRVYWPRIDLARSPYEHPLWTAAELLGNFEDLNKTRDRFREQMKRMLMQVSALSVLRPREIDEIRSFSAKLQIAELKSQSRSISDYIRIAESYIKENDSLQCDNQRLQEELDAAYARLEAQNEILRYSTQSKLDFEPEKSNESTNKTPKQGEIRFYKKKYSTPGSDVMISVQDCGHEKWKSTAKAPKAQKGVRRLEGTSGWASFWHCAACEGGGMWKVKW